MSRDLPTLTPQTILQKLESRFCDGLLTLRDLPHPSKLKDMDRAVERIVRAIESRERIVLIGDYDVDGVSSVSVMRLFFASIGYELDWIIPNRFRDGYGLSTSLIDRVEGYDLIITVDNGISAIESADICASMGIDLIITDHHIAPSTLPKAYAIIDQKQSECSFPYNEICGAQIAWYLCTAINVKMGTKIDMKQYLGVVALAVVADIMPLQHINRVMVQYGLGILTRGDMPFIEAYMEHSDKSSISSEDIAFGLAPILNSAGRLEDASLAVEFICSDSVDRATMMLEELIALNEQRKGIESSISEQVIDSVDESSSVIVAYSEEWHEGVVGIVAARVARHYQRPAIILCANGDTLKGSGRSFGECDLFGIVNPHRDILIKFGGHSMAIGLSISTEQIAEFRARVNRDYDTLHLNRAKYIDPDILGHLDFGYIDFGLIELMEQFEPYGEANSRPKFMTRGVKIVSVQQMGREKNHLRFALEHRGVIQTAVQFKTREVYRVGEYIDITYTISKNSFRDSITIQLMIDEVERVG